MKKFLLCLMAICFVVTGGFCLSACNSEKSQTDTDQVAEQLESTKKDFEDRMWWFGSTHFRSGIKGSYKRKYWTLGTSTNSYNLYWVDNKNYVVDESNGEILHSFTDGNEPEGGLLSNARVEEVIDDLYACEVVYYNGYLISLKSGEWTAYPKRNGEQLDRYYFQLIGYSFDGNSDNVIYFYQTYIDFLLGQYYAFVYWDSNLNAYQQEMCINVRDFYSGESLLFCSPETSFHGYLVDEEKGIVYKRYYNDTTKNVEKRMISFASSIVDLTIGEYVDFSWDLFKNRTLSTITFDNSDISIKLSLRLSSSIPGAIELTEDLAECAQYIYFKNGINIEETSPSYLSPYALFYSKFAKLTISDKDGYTKFVRIDN